MDSKISDELILLKRNTRYRLATLMKQLNNAESLYDVIKIRVNMGLENERTD